MSMIGNYLRVAPAVLVELFNDPSGISDLLYADEEPPSEMQLDIDKSWHLIHFLLTGHAWEGSGPVALAVLGGEPIGDEDVGYGPARGLNPAEVASVANALATLSPAELWSRFDARAAKLAEIYPDGWSGAAHEREYVLGHYAELQRFFVESAAAGDAVIAYLN